jgi:rubrerythrin
MPPFDREVPQRIWWCFACHGGVGVWGLDRDEPPPRCPECHGADFAPVKFVPAKPKKVRVSGARKPRVR